MNRHAFKTKEFGQRDVNALDETFRAWMETDKEILQLVQQEPTVQENSDLKSADFLSREAALSGLQARQHSLIAALIASPAKNIDEILKKLCVWKSITCPGNESLDSLSPTDEIVLSALNDLFDLQNS